MTSGQLADRVTCHLRAYLGGPTSPARQDAATLIKEAIDEAVVAEREAARAAFTGGASYDGEVLDILERVWTGRGN